MHFSVIYRIRRSVTAVFEKKIKLVRDDKLNQSKMSIFPFYYDSYILTISEYNTIYYLMSNTLYKIERKYMNEIRRDPCIY